MCLCFFVFVCTLWILTTTETHQHENTRKNKDTTVSPLHRRPIVALFQSHCQDSRLDAWRRVPFVAWNVSLYTDGMSGCLSPIVVFQRQTSYCQKPRATFPALIPHVCTC